MDKINIVDDHYDELDIDIDKVKAKPTMYISNIGDKGVEHLAHEMLDNITDDVMRFRSIPAELKESRSKTRERWLKIKEKLKRGE